MGALDARKRGRGPCATLQWRFWKIGLRRGCWGRPSYCAPFSQRAPLWRSLQHRQQRVQQIERQLQQQQVLLLRRVPPTWLK